MSFDPVCAGDEMNVEGHVDDQIHDAMRKPGVVGQRLRVAVLNRQFVAAAGGAERYSLAMVEHLSAQCEIHVFAQRIGHEWQGVTYHRVSKLCERPRWLNQLWYALVTWWLTRRGFDVVHSHENTWHGQVQTVHVLPVKYNLFHTGRKLPWLRAALSPRLWTYLALERSRFVQRPSRMVVAASQTLAEKLAGLYPGAALQVLTPGVENVYGVATAAEKTAARRALGLPETGLAIVFVANDVRKKGLDTLIQAMRKLPDDSFLVIVGPRTALTLSCGEKVFWAGQVKDIHQVYVAGDMLAHPTREDTFGMVVLEAMAHGLPVVVSQERYCGISALLRHRHHAILLDNPYDADTLAQALLELMQTPGLWAGLQTAGLAFAGANLWSQQAMRQFWIYKQVANRA